MTDTIHRSRTFVLKKYQSVWRFMTLLQSRVPGDCMTRSHAKWEILCKDREILCYSSVSHTMALSLDSTVRWKLFQAFLETLKHLRYV